MVTPFRFRAVTSSPRGKWRSIFLTGGLVKCFLRISFSSIVVGDVLIFLQAAQTTVSRAVLGEVKGEVKGGKHTSQSSESPWRP